MHRALLVMFLLEIVKAAEIIMSQEADISITNLALSRAFRNISCDSTAVCAFQCMQATQCLAAVFESDKLICHLFNAPLLFSERIKTGHMVYMDREEQRRCKYVGDVCAAEPVYTDCQDAFTRGQRTPGVRYLQLVKNGALVSVWCAFDSQRGWTVIQRRMDGRVDFYRGWSDYKAGFGFVTGEYWLGLDNISILTNANRRLSILLEDHAGEIRYANYTVFYIDGEATKFKMTIGGFSGTAGDSLSGHNGKSFTTRDCDNDDSSSNCAISYEGAWWYTNCHASNLNGIYYQGGNTTSYATGAVWYSWKEYYYSYKTVIMMISH